MAYILIPLSLAALVVVVILARSILNSLRARDWPQQMGEVLESTIERKAGRAGYQYYVRVRYAYSEPTRQESTSVLPSQFGTSREAYAQRLFQRFYDGARVPVFVDPRDPARSVLMPGVEGREWAVLVLMFGVFLWTAVAAFVL